MSSPVDKSSSKPGSGWYFVVLNFTRYVFFGLLSGGIRVRGKENFPKDGPVIVAPNHISFIDPPVTACASPRAIGFMAKEELFKPPVFVPLIRSLGAFPVKRGIGDKAAISLAIDRLKDGQSLLMFPEGTRGDGKTMRELQSGVALVARRSGAKVVPAGICGTHKMMPKGKSIPRFAKVTVVFGEPIAYADFASRDEFNAALRERLKAACAEAGLPLSDPAGIEDQASPETSGTEPSNPDPDQG